MTIDESDEMLEKIQRKQRVAAGDCDIEVATSVNYHVGGYDIHVTIYDCETIVYMKHILSGISLLDANEKYNDIIAYIDKRKKRNSHE